MYDELERSGDKIDTKLLGEMIGVPIVPTVSRTGFGTQELWQTIIDVFEDKHSAVRHVHVNLGQDIEHSVNTIKNMLKANDNMETKTLNKLCIALECKLEDIAEYIEEE